MFFWVRNSSYIWLCAKVNCLLFSENQYTIETLQIIERKEIEELIPPPYLAERTKCVHGLNNWRAAQVRVY